MSASSRRVPVIAFVLAVACASPAAAQTLASYCDVTVANEVPNGDVLHPATVYTAFKGQIDRNEWGQIARALEDDFRESASSVPSDMRVRFQAQLTAFADEMVAVEQSADAAAVVARAKGVNQVRFRIETNVRDGGYSLFGGNPAERIDIPDDAAPAIAKEICYRAHAVWKILVRYGQDGRQGTLNALGYYVSLWDNYNRQGYSQYPWELYLNGLWTVKPGTFQPPSSQWVIAHPAVAVEATWPRSADLRRLDIITFEPIGYLRYTRDRKSYGGVSLLITLSATADPGYGGLAHIGRIGKVGYVFHPRDESGGTRHGAVFSIDLYKLIGGVPQKLQDAKASVEAIRDSFR